MDDLALDLDVDFPEHLEALREALDAFVDHARHAGMDTQVPTTPEWTVRQLLAHQGMVHRWAISWIVGTRIDPRAAEAEGLEVADPVLWLRTGGHRLLKALEEAPVDLDTRVFLNDAPAPRLFWARRQCHETTIHSVDALSAALGRVPNADDTWITRQIALDGIDELLTGFLTRESSHPRSEDPIQLRLPADGRGPLLAGAGRHRGTCRPARQSRARRRRARGARRGALPERMEPHRRGRRRGLRPLVQPCTRDLDLR